jgi:hypothetical protein
VFSYEVDGSILILRASGTTTLSERQRVFNAGPMRPFRLMRCCCSTSVRSTSVRAISPSANTPGLNAYVLVDQLGRKLGPVCAVIVSPGLAEQSRLFQDAGSGVGLRVGLFRDEPSARQWLRAHR